MDEISQWGLQANITAIYQEPCTAHNRIRADDKALQREWANFQFTEPQMILVR